ncbi:MAG: 4Fe-4S dicluster domain-containing protein [Peptococcaceae bacterium]|nr:4Fe-4S dicluster domain-containing protein [Peptococcaceae bacterium]
MTGRIILRFPDTCADKPIIYYLVKSYDLEVNILKANINPHKEGTMILELTGSKYEEGLQYLRSLGITVQSLAEEIARHEQKCTHCGACTAVCPSGALHMERPSMEVTFEGDKCVVCQMCVKACPVGAMEVRF